MTTFRSIEALIEEAKKQWAYTKPHLPQVIMKEISLRPSWGIDCVSHLEKHDWHLDEERTEILLRLIDEGLSQIRYSVDRKETAGSVLRKQLEKTLIQVIPTLPQEARVAVNQLLFEAKISIDLEIEESDFTGDCPPQTQIMPRLPELLDEIRREKVAKNAYELYEILLPHVQLLPAEYQLSIIAELAHSKKAIAHEVSVLMLLHPKSSVRKHIAQLLCSLSDERLFTPVDLRRLIVIRNWVPSAERQDIDKLIARLRKKGMAPAPFLGAKISNLVGSSMDGAGASFILLESKKNNKRQVSGFITKLGVGIRDPWTISKAPKHYFDGIMKDKGETPIKTVSTTYVNKLVQHFLSEAINSGEVPEPNLSSNLRNIRCSVLAATTTFLGGRINATSRKTIAAFKPGAN